MIDKQATRDVPFKSNNDMTLERILLSDSGLFDASGYSSHAGDESRTDPLGHYILTGWKMGLEPNDSFAGSFSQPYFATLGVDEPPAISWLALRAAGWPVYANRASIEYVVEAIRNSGLFDENHYLPQLGPVSTQLDPLVHYVLVGERLGLSPSREFDPRYYGDRNPDVRDARMNYLFHYANFGRGEGRLPMSADLRTAGRVKFDPAKPSVILVVHETSRTGAPILGWNLAGRLSQKYNLFTVRLGDGELTEEYERLSIEVYGPFVGPRHCELDIEYSLRPLLEARTYRYAIVNSIAGRLVVEPCVRRFVPTIMLVHEFASYMGPPMPLQNSIDWSTEVVYSAPVVARASESVHPNMAARRVRLIPQGITTLPPQTATPTNDITAAEIIAKLDFERKHHDAFVVLGCGFIHFRKGVDLFLSTAAAVQRRHPRRPVHFLWLGGGFRPKEDMEYSVYLQEQIDRTDLNDHVTFSGLVADVEPAYRIADAFFLSSRLDPLPNAAMDAFVAGIPVFCFRESSGIADLMLSDTVSTYGVVDYLDVDAVASKIVEVADDDDLRQRLSRSMKELAARYFDMDGYVKKLDAIGNAAFDRLQQRRADAKVLADDLSFDADMFMGPTTLVETREATIVRYLALAAARGWNSLPATDHYFRRPAPGFNPRIYAASHPKCVDLYVDPLADFIRHGKPPGPWQLQVLSPEDERAVPLEATKLRVALHMHLFYPELCGDFLQHLASNMVPCDLFFTTDHRSKMESIERSLAGYSRGTVDIRIVPNRGRDIGAFLTAFSDTVDQYDVIGHLHAKRSKWKDGKPAEDTWGESWREFLWQNMVGGLYPMLDRIIDAFAGILRLAWFFPATRTWLGGEKT